MSAPKTAERWVEIPGHPGYKISTEGRIRSERPWRGTTDRILNPSRNAVSGYLQVSLSDGARFVKRNVHALVMLAFIGPRPDGLEVRHLDGDPANVRLANLAYGTHAENEADKVRHGTPHNYGSRTHCKHDHEFTPENTAIWHSRGKPFRQCVTCANARRERKAVA